VAGHGGERRAAVLAGEAAVRVVVAYGGGVAAFSPLLLLLYSIPFSPSLCLVSCSVLFFC
jgi:hypothetical protein